MFDIGWSELLLVGAIAVLVIGPRDIPKIMYQAGRFARRLQYMKFAMSQQFDEILRAGDIEELRKGVNFEAPKTDEAAADADEHQPAATAPPEEKP
jgi:sec-independent protein translocase protein TatB